MGIKKFSGDEYFLAFGGTIVQFLPALLIGYLLQKVTPWGWAIATVALTIYAGQDTAKFIAWRYWLIKTRTRGAHGINKSSVYQDKVYNRKWAFIGVIIGTLIGLFLGITFGFYGLVIVSVVELLTAIPLLRWSDMMERKIPDR